MPDSFLTDVYQLGVGGIWHFSFLRVYGNTNFYRVKIPHSVACKGVTKRYSIQITIARVGRKQIDLWNQPCCALSGRRFALPWAGMLHPFGVRAIAGI